MAPSESGQPVALVQLVAAYHRGELSRREFLEKAKGVAVGGLVPGLFTSVASAADRGQQDAQPPTALHRADDVRRNEATRHGGYLCLNRTQLARIPASAVTELAERLGLHNEFEPGDTPA